MTTWRHLNSSSDAVLDAFSQLDSPNLSILDETTADICYEFVLRKKIQLHQNYRRNKTPARVRETSTNRIAIRKKVIRSHYVANIWFQAEKSHMDYLNPIEYGWESTDDGFVTPELTDFPAVPNVIMEMSLRHCKTPCITNRCVCKKVELKCTQMCFCQYCKNFDLADYSDKDVEDEISDKEDL